MNNSREGHHWCHKAAYRSSTSSMVFRMIVWMDWRSSLSFFILELELGSENSLRFFCITRSTTSIRKDKSCKLEQINRFISHRILWTHIDDQLFLLYATNHHRAHCEDPTRILWLCHPKIEMPIVLDSSYLSMQDSKFRFQFHNYWELVVG